VLYVKGFGREVTKFASDNELKSLGLSGRALTDIRATPVHNAADSPIAFNKYKASRKNQTDGRV